MECRIFVYGTLKRGQKYHHHLRGSEFMGPAVLSGPFKMYLEPGGDYPLVIRTPGENRKIFGEVYVIETRKHLLALDEFEDAPDL